MTTQSYNQQLTQFRDRLYHSFGKRADTLMELVDAMCSNATARSVAEYSLTACFRRTYSALYKAVASCQRTELGLARLLAPCLPRPQQRRYWLLGVDVTSQRRLYAPTLADRGMVYDSNPVKGNRPITVGHQYSSVAMLPEAEENLSSSWVVPLCTSRVHTHEDKELVGAAQIDALLKDSSLPFHQGLCVEVVDSGYSKVAYLYENRHHANLVTIARVRNNRVFYRQPEPRARQVGRPRWYGTPFVLSDPTTWHEPDERAYAPYVSCRGKTYQVEMLAWHNLLAPGQRKPKPMPMYLHPFTLVRIALYDEEGRQAFRHPLWLIVIGERRHELSVCDVYQAYSQRYNMEHFFRFGKQQLLLDRFQTPDDGREETWWQLAHIAFAQLWVARHVARCFPRPWERNLPTMRDRRMSPTLVQRDFARVICQIGTPACLPKRRGYSPGRPVGTKLPPRPHHKVVIKSQLMAQKC